MGDKDISRVLVLDGHTRTALAVTRSLGRRGIEVVVAASGRTSLAGASRYCKQNLVYPNPAESSDAFTEWLYYNIRDNKYGLLLPLTDTTTVIAARLLTDCGLTHLAMLPSPDALEHALDKRSLMQLAMSCGIDIPITYPDASDDSIGFPVLIKSNRSLIRYGDIWINGRMMQASDTREMFAAYRQIDEHTPQPIVQEYIPGWGEGLFLLCVRGHVKAAFAHRRLKESPPNGGVSTSRMSIPVDRRLLDKSTRLLEKLQWHGPVMLEFRYDTRDGKPKLIELNPRLWGSLHLAVISGMDFPWLIYRAARGENLNEYIDYEKGIVSRWLLGDINRTLLIVLKRKKAEYAPQIRYRANRAYVEIETLDDIKPSIYEYAHYLRSTASIAYQKLCSGGVER